MRRPVDTLSKEKWLFLFSACAAGIALQQFIATSPLRLEPRTPVSHIEPSKPVAAPNVNSVPEAVVANADIWTPFAPWHRPPPLDPNVPLRGGGTTDLSFGGPAESTVKDLKKPRPFPAQDLVSAYTYMGVVIFNGEPYGLLKPNTLEKSAESRRVKIGDVLSDCTVIRVEPQAVWLQHRGGKIFVLKDKSKLAM